MDHFDESISITSHGHLTTRLSELIEWDYPALLDRQAWAIECVTLWQSHDSIVVVAKIKRGFPTCCTCNWVKRWSKEERASWRVAKKSKQVIVWNNKNDILSCDWRTLESFGLQITLGCRVRKKPATSTPMRRQRYIPTHKHTSVIRTYIRKCNHSFGKAWAVPVNHTHNHAI